VDFLIPRFGTLREAKSCVACDGETARLASGAEAPWSL
jgi:hypothetical protein